jgi:hypothetical protein
MLKSNKHVFWEALIITIFIFGIGILFGIFLENSRANKVSELYLKSEINLLDVKVQTEVLNTQDLNCEEAVSQNIKFADKIYEDAKLLEDYDDASRIDNDFVEYHKRYDLLRTLLWLNSIKIKEKCGADSFHTIVYLYDYKTENIEEKNKQEIISRFLEELKNEHGNKIILVPIAKNLDISSIDLLIKNYNVTGTSVIVDEKTVVSELEDLNKISAEIGSASQ